jgi:hypothetical protein
VRDVRRTSSPGRRTVAAASLPLEHDDWDDAAAGTPLVGLIPVVVVVDALPKLCTFSALDDARADLDAPTANLDGDRIGMRADVVIPGRMVLRAGLGGNDNEAIVVRGCPDLAPRVCSSKGSAGPSPPSAARALAASTTGRSLGTR